MRFIAGLLATLLIFGLVLGTLNPLIWAIIFAVAAVVLLFIGGDYLIFAAICGLIAVLSGLAWAQLHEDYASPAPSSATVVVHSTYV